MCARAVPVPHSDRKRRRVTNGFITDTNTNPPPRGGERRARTAVPIAFLGPLSNFLITLYLFFLRLKLCSAALATLSSPSAASRTEQNKSESIIRGWETDFVIVLITIVVVGASRKLTVCWGIPPELGLDSGGAGLDHPMIPNAEDKSLGLQLSTFN